MNFCKKCFEHESNLLDIVFQQIVSDFFVILLSCEILCYGENTNKTVIASTYFGRFNQHPEFFLIALALDTR